MSESGEFSYKAIQKLLTSVDSGCCIRKMHAPVCMHLYVRKRRYALTSVSDVLQRKLLERSDSHDDEHLQRRRGVLLDFLLPLLRQMRRTQHCENWK